MRVSCPSCQTNYNIDDKRVPPGGAKLKCSKCQTLFPIKPAAAPAAPAPSAIPLPGAGAAPKPPSSAIPLPGSSAAAPAAIPLPGLTAARPQQTVVGGADPFGDFGDGSPGAGERWDEESTRVANIPLPREALGERTSVVPLPAAGPPPPAGTDFSFDSGAVPLPGAQPPARDFSFDSGAVPLPGSQPPAMDFSFDSGSVPLPGSQPAASPPSFDFDFGAPPEQTAGAVPLPGFAGAQADEDEVPFDDSAVALPGPDDGLGAAEAPPAQDPGFSIPLPGHGAAAAEEDAFSIPLPGHGEAAAAEDGFSIPLPGHGAAAAAEDAFSIPLPGHGQPAEDGFAVPLPGDPPAHDAFSIDLPEEQTRVVPQPSDFAVDFSEPPPAAPAASFDFGDLPAPAGAPPPAQDFAVDFSERPQPAAHAAIAPPPPEDFAVDFGDFGNPPAETPRSEEVSIDFGELPSPAGAPPPAQDFSADFGELPSPAGAPPPAQSDSLDFSELPSPAAPPPAPAYQAPPPAVDLGASFGDVDFGDPAPAPAAAPSPSPSFDDLEFDPTSSRKPAAADELEADLSAPLPPARPAQATDGLEMLSFIDDTARDAGAEKVTRKRFHVRRRSGKVFGPFEEGVVVKMLEDGQLLGNEDVSPDGDTWSAIGTVPAFHEAIAKLMEAPTGGLSADAEQQARQQSSAQTMERLKSLYDGRMAAVTVVDGHADAVKFRRRLPLVIAAAVIVLIGAAGGALGLTRYGVFGLKLLMPAKVRAGSPQFTQLEKARAALLADTYQSYSEARDVTAGILKVKEFPEVRAVWCQAIFYLNRRYADAKPAELARAREELPNIALLGEKQAEVVKARAGDALAADRPDEARLLLEDAVIRNDADPELKLLLAEAYVELRQPDRAAQTLEKVLARNADSAKAMHGLAVLHRVKAERLMNAGKREEADVEAKRAEELFAGAMKADEQHVISAVELAGLQILVHRNAEKGQAALEKALAEESTRLMGPAEVARARALNGAALAMKFKVAEAVAEFEHALKLDKQSVFAKAQLGRILIQQREFPKAIPLFQEASKKEPTNLDYVDGYLTSLIGSGKMNDALGVLQSANSQFPDTPRIAYLDARVNDALDNIKKAEDNYLRALKGDDDLYEAHLHLARLYLRGKRLEEARQQLEAGLQKAPQSALVNAGMGELLLAEGKPAEARTYLEKAEQLDPTLAEAKLGLSRAALQEGRVEEAAGHVDRALALDPSMKGGFLQKGEVLWAQGKLDDAVAALEEAKKNEPSNARISITLGAVKLDKSDLPGAEAALLGALTNEPRNHQANFYLARVKSRRAEHTQAIESMRSALEASPQNPAYHYEMGLVFKEAKKLTEAMAEWEQTIQLDPAYADAMEQLGRAHLERGQFEEAIARFEAALQVDPARGALYGAIGDAWFQATAWDKAIRGYQQALKADPTLTYVYYKIGRALSEQGKPGQAIEWYRRATSVEPDNAMPWYYLGYLHKERKARKEAITAFRNYLAKRPDAPEKAEIEDEIYDLQQGI